MTYLRPTLRLVQTRRSLRDFQRDLLVQRFAEIEALRADLKRLQRQTTDVARCHQCHRLATITLDDDGAWRCVPCAFHRETKGA